MARSSRLFLLLSAYTALLIIPCGVECTTASAASPGATNRATCTAGSDEPHCKDPSSIPSQEEISKQAAAKIDLSARDREVCSGSNCSNNNPKNKKHKQKASSAFQSGDIIELYNTESTDIQIVFPSIVKSRDSSGVYSVTKTTDGKEVKNIPEKFLHMYEPYTPGSEVLCNIGEFKPARPIIVRCTVLGYDPTASRGAMVLQGNYEVQVHATKANEEYKTSLPVWKLQRRYLAGKKEQLA